MHLLPAQTYMALDVVIRASLVELPQCLEDGDGLDKVSVTPIKSVSCLQLPPRELLEVFGPSLPVSMGGQAFPSF